jgi:hypothetical protein
MRAEVEGQLSPGSAKLELRSQPQLATTSRHAHQALKCQFPRSLVEFSLQRQREQLLLRLDQMLVTVFRHRAGVFDLHRAPAGFVV